MHSWSYEENRICCEKCVETYVINKKSIGTLELVKELHEQLIEVPEGSLIKKICNIKQLFIEMGIENTLKASKLEHYSKDNKKAMIEVLNEYNIPYTK
ncbi:MAG: hypothetical protein PUE69_06120 [Ruminococcus sp.]|nr:hypothetical protein [Ruminococcus sp.]MDY3843571.1 hypothetical protein [Ruminococcus sp.]